MYNLSSYISFILKVTKFKVESHCKRIPDLMFSQIKPLDPK